MAELCAEFPRAVQAGNSCRIVSLLALRLRLPNLCGEAEHEQPQPQLAKCQRRPQNCRAIHSAALKAGAGARQAMTAATERSGEATATNQRSNYRPRGRNSQTSDGLPARGWPPSVAGLRSATKTRAAQRAQRAGASAIDKEYQQARSVAAK